MSSVNCSSNDIHNSSNKSCLYDLCVGRNATSLLYQSGSVRREWVASVMDTRRSVFGLRSKRKWTKTLNALSYISTLLWPVGLHTPLAVWSPVEHWAYTEGLMARWPSNHRSSPIATATRASRHNLLWESKYMITSSNKNDYIIFLSVE